jgi:hypothetical protein
LSGVDFGIKVGGFEIEGGRVVYVVYIFCTDKIVATD